jgi:hypothetical protein
MKTFHEKHKVKQFMATKPALQMIHKGILHKKMKRHTGRHMTSLTENT